MTGGGAGAGVRIAAVRRAIACRFREAGLDTPDLDARLIVGHVLGLDHAGLTRESERALGPRALAGIEALAVRRLAGEPVARLVGVKEFWSLPFAVTSAVMVPRPETETVVEAALARLDAAGMRERPLRIADLGTGSGAILLALLHEMPLARGIGTDCSVAAVETARENAQRLGFSNRAAFVACDFGAALGGVETISAAAVGIGDNFVLEVEQLMKPGSSALFVLDDEGDMDAILIAIRGLGGRVLTTNVNLERAKLIQAALAAASDDTIKPARQ